VTQRVRTVAICGFGLIGGSIALDLLSTKPRPKIVVYDKPSILKSLKRMKRFPVVCGSSLESAVSSADIAILSAPPKQNRALLAQLSGIRSLNSCLILDVGSIKRSICAIGKTLSFGGGTQFIGCHPLAGIEKSGCKNAVSGLFGGHPWFSDKTVSLTRENSTKLTWLVNALHARHVRITPSDHDMLVAIVSHLPQLLSTTLAAQLSPNMIALAGTGLKGMLRLAGSPHALWSDILSENNDEVIDALGAYRDNLSAVIARLKQGASLDAIFKLANRSYQCL
jgi:prephenate dehydrogenase